MLERLFFQFLCALFAIIVVLLVVFAIVEAVLAVGWRPVGLVACFVVALVLCESVYRRRKHGEPEG